MTCIIGFRDKDAVYLAGDRSLTRAQSGRQNVVSYAKVKKHTNFIVGASGAGGVLQVVHSSDWPRYMVRDNPYQWVCGEVLPFLRARCELHNIVTLDKEGQKTYPTFMIAAKGRLFEIDSNLGVFEVSAPFQAVGYCDEALGALAALVLQKVGSPREMLRKALGIAAKYNAFVIGPFDIIQLRNP